MRILIVLIINFGFLLGGHGALQAQSYIEKSLREPVQKALDKSAAVQIKRAEAGKVQIDKEMAEAKKLPQVSLFGGYGFLYSRLNNEFPTHYLPVSQTALFENALISNLSTQVVAGGVSARQVIFAGRQISNGQKALEEKQKAAQFLAEAGKEEVVKEVISTCDQLMLLNEVEKLIRDSENRLEKEQQKVQKGIENGLAVPYDRDKIQLALLELEEKKAELEGGRELLYAKLKYLTGMSLEELKEINYQLNPVLLGTTADSPEKRLEIKALESGQKARELAYQKEKGNYWPTVFAFGSLSYVNAFDTRLKLRDVPALGNPGLHAEHLRLEPAAAVGIGLKWEVFKGGENQKKIKKAAVDLAVSALQLKDTREQLELLIQKNKTAFKTAEKRINVAAQQVKVAQNNLRLATRQYAVGLTDLTERLAAENDFYKMNLNYYNQILNQRSAGMELLLSTGELLEKINHE